MKKVVKAIILTPMWPLIWLKMGLNLKRNCWHDHCQFCGGDEGCCHRAHAMVSWYRK